MAADSKRCARIRAEIALVLTPFLTCTPDCCATLPRLASSHRRRLACLEPVAARPGHTRARPGCAQDRPELCQDRPALVRAWPAPGQGCLGSARACLSRGGAALIIPQDRPEVIRAGPGRTRGRLGRHRACLGWQQARPRHPLAGSARAAAVLRAGRAPQDYMRSWAGSWRWLGGSWWGRCGPRGGRLFCREARDADATPLRQLSRGSATAACCQPPFW